jgi:hypothetical protein
MRMKTAFFIILLLAFSAPVFGQGLIELYPNHIGSSPHNAYGFVCKTQTSQDQNINFTHSKNRCKNDEAKSMALTGFFKRGTKIILYDHPDGKHSDDWFEVEFLQDMANVRYIIPTFEISFQDRFIKAVYHKKNGLDGKVSRMDVRVPH